MSFPWIAFPVLSILLGYPVVSRLAPRFNGKPSAFVWKAAASLGLGMGIQSLILFLWLKIHGSLSPAFNWILVALAVSGLALAFILRAKRKSPNLSEEPASSPGTFAGILLPYFLIGLSLALAFSVMHLLLFPHGAWDAWSHWNLRARFIFRGGELWTNAFHPDFWNPLNYPLMLPLNVAAGWSLAGFETAWISGGVAMAFMLGAGCLLYSSLAMIRGRSQGCLAAIILLGTPFFLIHGNSQYSDIPLAFFFLATFAAASLHDVDETHPVSFLVLSGLLAGLAAWTKNEGLLFIGCFFAARFVARGLALGFVRALRELLWLGAGLAPALALVFYVKTQLYPPRSIFETRGVLYSFAKFTDSARYVKIITGMGKAAFDFGMWALPFPAALIVYMLWVKPQADSKIRNSGIGILVTLALMMVCYFLVYLSTPHNLDWHLGTSINRLILCLWPSFLFAFFLLVKTPEEVLAGVPAQESKPVKIGESAPCT